MVSDLLVLCNLFSVTCALSASDSLYESVTSTKHSHGSNSKQTKYSQPLCWDAFAPLCWLPYRSHSVSLFLHTIFSALLYIFTLCLFPILQLI